MFNRHYVGRCLQQNKYSGNRLNFANLQMMAENKNILDVCITYASTDLAWPQSLITNFIAFFGVCWVSGSLAAKKFIERFGIRRFTSGSNVMAALGFLFWAGIPSGWALWVGTFFLMFGLERRQGVSRSKRRH